MVASCRFPLTSFPLYKEEENQSSVAVADLTRAS